MQAGSGLIQNIDGPSGAAPGELSRQLDPLGFTAGQGGGRLPQLDIPETDFIQSFDLAADLGNAVKEAHGFLHRHFQHIMDALALVFYLQCLPVIPAALADFTGHKDIRQEVHLNFQDTIAFTGFTPATLDVEGKASAGIALEFGVRCLGKQFPDIGKHTGIGGRIGTRCPSDGRLVNVNNLVQLLNALQAIVIARLDSGGGKGLGQRFVEHLIDQAGLTGTRYTRHTGKGSQRNGNSHILQIVLTSSPNGQKIAIAGPALGRHQNLPLAGQILTGIGPVAGHDFLQGSGADDLAAVNTGSRSHIHDEIGSPHGIFVMLYHNQGVAQIPQPLQGGQQLVIVPLMQTDGRLIQNIEHAYQAGTDLGSQPDPLAFTTGQGGRRPRKGQILQTHAL